MKPVRAVDKNKWCHAICLMSVPDINEAYRLASGKYFIGIGTNHSAVADMLNAKRDCVKIVDTAIIEMIFNSEYNH